jgi:hypothetical protein
VLATVQSLIASGNRSTTASYMSCQAPALTRNVQCAPPVVKQEQSAHSLETFLEHTTLLESRVRVRVLQYVNGKDGEEHHIRSLQRGLNDVSIKVGDFCYVAYKCQITLGVMWPRQGAPLPPSQPQTFPPLAPGYHLALFTVSGFADAGDFQFGDVPIKRFPGVVSPEGSVQTLDVKLSITADDFPSGESVDAALSVQWCGLTGDSCSNAPAEVRAFVYAVDTRWLETGARANWNTGIDTTASVERGLDSGGYTGSYVRSSLESILSVEASRSWQQVRLNTVFMRHKILRLLKGHNKPKISSMR